ncbi:MAG: tetratricopeptide repeat protein [Thermoguttaceae bacterium]|jgi:tetratricopeptide (TPR) repeat protein
MTSRSLAAYLFLMLPIAAGAAAAEDHLAAARKLLLQGHYAEAAESYRPLSGKEPAAAVGLARCLEAQGKLDAAVASLAGVAHPDAAVEAELARLAFQRGDVKGARQHADAAIRLKSAQVLAHWILAELDRTAGRLDDADRGYRWLIEYYNAREVKQADTLHWIGLAAAEYARWNRLADQFHFLVNDLHPEGLKLDPSYWPAHYEAGLLFLEKYNRADAAKEFQAALEQNPQAAEVHVAMAQLAMEGREIERAEAALHRALEINPRLLEAWLVTADLAWANFNTAAALEILDHKALPLCPIREETLGRIAACYVLLDGLPEAGRLQRLIAEVSARNPHAGRFYLALAEALQTRNKQSEAERFFREAIRVMPRLVGPQADLGMLYMRMGREEEARRQLRQAFEADPFHVRVKNTLEVLDVLDGMETLSTTHFLIKYGKEDKLLARYVARHVETVYQDLTRQFGYEPPQKSLIEIFNQAQGQGGHAWFSARMIGLPYVGTVAATTGPMVAMVSPGELKAERPFNWARVLRHELVHVVTLQQTKFNIPHWYTEGLAVWREDYPRPERWNELLRQRVPRGKIFNLDTLNFGFARPESGDDWAMAYCQAELYVEYMLAHGGQEALRKMLAAYTANLSTAEAIRRVFGMSAGEFDRGYQDYLRKLAAGLAGLAQPSQASLAELLAAHRAQADDPDAAARLAYAQLQRGAVKEARELAEKAARRPPKQQLAAYVLARLQVEAGHAREATRLLDACLDRMHPDALALNLLAGLKLKEKNYDAAAALYALGERLDPANPKWTRALARVYTLAENRRALADVLTRLARADSDDGPVRKKLAELCLARRDYVAAAHWANQSLEIDVSDADPHRLLAEALVGQQQYGPAIEEFETAVDLNPANPQQQFALADACVQAKQVAKARQVLQKLLKLVPDYPGAEVLLESIRAEK